MKIWDKLKEFLIALGVMTHEDDEDYYEGFNVGNIVRIKEDATIHTPNDNEGPPSSYAGMSGSISIVREGEYCVQFENGVYAWFNENEIEDGNP